MRHFPRPVERVVKYLDKLISDPDQPRDVRLRGCELLLAAYGVPLPPDREPRRKGLRRIVKARLGVESADREISRKSKPNKEQLARLKQELENLKR